MKNTKKQILSFFIGFLFIFIQMSGLLVAQKNVNAGTLWDSQAGMGLSSPDKDVIGKEGFSNPTTNVRDIRVIIARLIYIFLGFLGLVFIVLIILAGFKWMNSQGNETTIGEAKSQIQSAFIGLGIVLAAYGITILATRYILSASFS